MGNWVWGGTVRRLVIFAAFAMALWVSPRAEAYELDTHFYDTYAMAREAGFKHDYARYIATGAQWVDEGLSSTAMGPAIIGTLLRRIWHFPGYRYKTSSTGHGRGGFKWISIATFNHPVAHKLFDEGMRQSNWMKIALAIHVIQDSAGHAGFSDALGHMEFGHNPDRTWVFPDKYKRMTGLVFHALVALRKVAPDEALESWALERRKAPVTAHDATELQESFWKKVAPLVSKDYFRDPRYTPTAVNEILRDAKRKGFIIENAGFQLERNLPGKSDYLAARSATARPDPLHGDRKDAREVLKEWVTQKRAAEIKKGILVKGSIFEMRALDAAGYKDVRLALERIESEERDPAKRAQRYHQVVTAEISRDVIHWTVDELARGHIPQNFGPYVHVQFESNEGPRKVENQLKVDDRRAFIKNAYGTDIEYGKKATTFGRKDRITAVLVKSGHNLRTAAHHVTRRGVTVHHDVKGYQSPSILNAKLESGHYPRMGELRQRSIFGRSRVRAPGRSPARVR